MRSRNLQSVVSAPLSPALSISSSRRRRRRFNVASRYGTAIDSFTAQRFESFVAGQDSVTEVKRTPAGRRVVEMTTAEARLLQATNPNLIVVEDQPLQLFKPPGYAAALAAVEGKFALRVNVRDETTGAPLPNVTLYGIGEAANFKAVTDQKGNATLKSFEDFLTRIVVSPAENYWSRVLNDVEISAQQDRLDIALRVLPTNGDYTWGHRLMRFDKVNRRWRGRGVKVAVIDSGVVSDNRDLHPVGGYNTLEGAKSATWNVDEKGHGTHCAGVIASRHNNTGISGGAPDAEIYSLKVFPGGMVSDIIEAVEWCIINRIDVLSMSLGAANPDPTLEQVLRDAYTRGLTIIAAAGNDHTRVAYPAAYDTVIAVSALGRFGTFPDDSDHVTKIGAERDWTGEIFAAAFTNFGPEICVCAPGVAIVSTVPHGYVAWDGTSMACPMVSALVALILEAYPQIRTRDHNQSAYVRSILQASCIDTGLPQIIQGSGLPRADAALLAAAAHR